uniref:Chemotaxis methyl-accepting receptor HlyB-like 4HB MCP domain-containing protein n=1 Tax=Anopheles coluzzii TaxID=1518534 RepID=A0A8W7PSR1_ANOCL
MLLVGSYAIRALHDGQQRFEYVRNNTFPDLKVMQGTLRAVADIRANTLRHINATASEEDRQLLAADKAMMAQYREGRSRILALSSSNQTAQAVALTNNEFTQTANQLMQAVEQHARFNYRLAEQLAAENDSTYQTVFAVALGLMAAALLLTGVLALTLYRNISHGLGSIQHTIEKTGQATADGQAQASATKAPAGIGFGLGEWFEQAGEVFLGNADAAIDDVKTQRLCSKLLLQHLYPQGNAAICGELHGIADKVLQDLAQPQGIQQQGRRQFFVYLQLQPQALGGGRLGIQEVQDVVDQPQQGACRLLNGADAVFLLRIERRHGQQFQHAQHAVHRGADFMAHGGQERTLGTIGGIGLVAGHAQLELGQLALGDIQAGQDGALAWPVRKQQHALEQHPDRPAIGPQAFQFTAQLALVLRHAVELAGQVEPALV